jgi:hypothetical protein
MNLLKTPHQKLMEEAGATIMPTPGLLNTPKQMLFQESGLLPKYADGKSVEAPTQEQMKAALSAAKADGKITQQEAQALRSMVFNIGKNVGDSKNALTHAQILEAIKGVGLEPENAHVVFAQPTKKFGPFEDTLVVKAKGNPKDLKEVTHSLAEALQQEAIPAKFVGEKTGVLAGPRAHEWGNGFEPNYFIEHGKPTAGGNLPPLGPAVREAAKKLAAPMLWNAPAIIDRGMEMSKGKDIAENAIGLALDVAPFTPATVAAGLMRPTDVGDATLDTWNKNKELEAQAYREHLRKTSPVFLK